MKAIEVFSMTEAKYN